MLWTYFDESGEHDLATGQLIKLTLGGTIATSETWEVVTGKWEKALKNAGIDMFHMTDFEANKREFEGWEKYPDRRKNLLKSLLDICAEHLHFHVGLVSNHPLGKPIRSTYRTNICDSIAMLRSRINPLDERAFALVYAKHPEFSFDRLKDAFDQIGDGDPRVRTCAVQEPLDVPALQVADIIAYEISRYHRKIRHNRYPWQRLVDSAGILIFSDQSLSSSSEGGFS